MVQPMKASILITADNSQAKPVLSDVKGQFTALGVAAQGATSQTKDLVAATVGLGRQSSTDGSRYRAADIAAYGAALDQLRAKHNPLFAVITHYKSELAEIRQAHKLGAISADEMTAAINRERQATLVSIAALKGRNTAQTSAIQGSKKLGFAFQNASYQIADTAVQIAAGTGAMRAMSMQLPQLLGGFGVWGAVAGAAVAVGGALAPMLFEQADGARTLSQRLSDLETAVADYQSASKAARATTSDMIKEFGSASTAVRTLLSDFEEFSRKQAERQINTLVNQVSGDLNRQDDVRVFLNLGNALNGLYGLTEEETRQVEALSFAFTRLGNVDGPAQQAKALADVRRLLEDALAASENVTDEQNELVQQLFQAEELARRLAGAMGGVGDQIARASTILDGLNAKISSGNLNQIGLDAQLSALQSGSSNELAKIAGNIAQRRSELSPLINSTDAARSQEAIDALARYETQLTKAAETEAKITAIHDARSKALREANRSSRSSARSAERLQEANRKALEGHNDNIAKLRVEMALVGQSEALQRRQMAVLNEIQSIKRAGLSLDDRISRQRIRAAAQSADLTSELERQKDAWGRVQSAGEGALDTIFDFNSLMEGDFEGMLNDILGSVGQMVLDLGVKNPMKNALFGTNLGTFGDLFGGSSQMGAMTVSTPLVNLNASGINGLTGGFNMSNLNTPFNGAQSAINRFANSTDAATQNLGVLGNGFDIFGRALSGLQGSGSGGNLFGSIGSIFSTILGGIFGFDEGGWTGPGGKNEPAGIVHRDEFVFNKEATRRIGVRTLDAMHRGAIKGYSSGGLVGSSNAYWPQAANTNQSAGNDNGLTLNIINQSSAQVSGNVEETQDNQGRRSYKLVLADTVGDAMEAKGGKANRVLKNNYGLRQRSVLR